MLPGQLPNDTLNKIKNGLGADHHQIGVHTTERQADILDDPLNMDRMDEGHGQGFGDPGLGAAGSEGIFYEVPSRSGFEVYDKEKSIDRIEHHQHQEVPNDVIQIDDIVGNNQNISDDQLKNSENNKKYPTYNFKN